MGGLNIRVRRILHEAGWVYDGDKDRFVGVYYRSNHQYVAGYFQVSVEMRDSDLVIYSDKGHEVIIRCYDKAPTVEQAVLMLQMVGWVV